MICKSYKITFHTKLSNISDKIATFSHESHPRGTGALGHVKWRHLKLASRACTCMSDVMFSKVTIASPLQKWKGCCKVAARLLVLCYYAAIKYVCNNWLRQSSQLEWLVACLQQPCSFYQRLQAHNYSQEDSKKIIQIYASGYLQSVAASSCLQQTSRSCLQHTSCNCLQQTSCNYEREI